MKSARAALLTAALAAGLLLAVGGESAPRADAGGRARARDHRQHRAVQGPDRPGVAIRQAFLGWGQGQTYGAPFAALFPMLGPIPMLHLGTGGVGTARR